MKILKIIGIVFLVIVVLFIIVGLFLPSKSYVERSVFIVAPSDAIYEEVNNITRFNKWSPWSEIDPATKYTYKGPDSGVGAKMAWTSESDRVGSGSMEIIEVRENEYVKNRMEFEGMDGNYISEIILEPQGEETTQVTWTYEGEVDNIMLKYMGLMIDDFLGPQYEQGLQKLKTFIENKQVPEESDEEEQVQKDSVEQSV